MKKRTIALMLSVLAVMMLVGVGFATWVISQSQELSSSGNIIVDTVTDERLFAKVTVVEAERKDADNKDVKDIIFGWKKPDPDFADPWLTNEVADKEQNMKVVLKLEVFSDSAMSQPTDKFTINGKAPAQIEVSDIFKMKAPKTIQVPAPTQEDPNNTEKVYAKEDPENDGQYIPATALADVVFEDLVLPQWVVNASKFEKSTTETTGVYLITIEFTWAAALSNLNPYLYFNESTSAATDKLAGLTVANNGDAALKVLKDLEALKPAELGGITPELQYKVSLDIKYSE